jgi:hypothetical protein
MIQVYSPKIREVTMMLSPYSDRGEIIGSRISVYEERERYIMENTILVVGLRKLNSLLFIMKR